MSVNTSKLKKLLLLATITVFSVWLHSQIKPTEINELGNLWGNTGGNILEGGLVATDGETIYVSSLDTEHSGLYRLDMHGKLIPIWDNLAYELNVLNDTIYFVNGEPGSICQINIDGTGFKTIVSKPCNNLIVNDKFLIYLCSGNLIVSDIGGKKENVIASDVRKVIPFKDMLVFIIHSSSSNGIYWARNDGTEPICLFEGELISVSANEDHIFFSVSNDIKSFGEKGGKVYQINEDGSISQLHVDDECWNINATQEFIFFRNQTKKGELYRMNTDGSNAICLLRGNCSNINIINDSLVFRVITAGQGVEAGYYIMELNGENLRSFDEDIV